MKPWLALRAADLESERPAGADDDVHFPESLAEAIIEEYSSPGGLLLDPFAGFGTSLVVAERMGRSAIGVELVAGRVELIRNRLGRSAQIVHGDARRLAMLVTGPIDLCFTSPPYMNALNHPENPLTGYATLDGDYGRYLEEIGDVFEQVGRLLRPCGHAIINVANMVTAGTVTPLAWDVARSVSRHLTFRGESVLCWDTPRAGFTGDYCLDFERT